MSIAVEAAGLCLVNQVTAADTRAIEAGLNELWRITEAGEVGGALVRAASMTVIVPIADQADAEAVTALIDELIDTHPCRAILVLFDERVDEPRARLASHIRRIGDAEGGRYWEEIRLAGPARATHQVMSSVAALALPNLPIQTWWPTEPVFDGDEYNHIVEISDRILLDSSRFGDVTRALPTLQAAIDVTHDSVAFADLSWTRLVAWRLLVAELFDPADDQAQLDSIERVRVAYAGGEAAQALLLAGWLASRLGWEPRSLTIGAAGAWAFEMADGVRPVRIDVARIDPTPAPGDAEAALGLRSVAIVAAEGGRRVSYTVERIGNGEEARALRDDGSPRESRAHLPIRDETELLREELAGFATDRIYHESLALITRLFENL
jgi:glucose-6-phosphate dehydrogenase assembly protein OpcA